MLLEIGVLGLMGVILSLGLWFRSALRNASRATSLESQTFFVACAAYIFGLYFVFISFANFNMFYIIAIAYALYILHSRELEPLRPTVGVLTYESKGRDLM